jgi:hypothetical protein
VSIHDSLRPSEPLAPALMPGLFIRVQRGKWREVITVPQFPPKPSRVTPSANNSQIGADDNSRSASPLDAQGITVDNTQEWRRREGTIDVRITRGVHC